jgi:pyruvate/2-oxoglutarate/acetoin dehydrogenase E1 component
MKDREKRMSAKMKTEVVLRYPKVSGLSSAAWYDKRPHKYCKASPGLKQVHSEAEIIRKVKEVL